MSRAVLKILKSDLSDGAKLAALAAIVVGAASVSEVAKLTQKSVRTVERHLAEYRNSAYADLRISVPQICVSGPADLRSEGDTRARAHIDSTFGRDSILKGSKKDSRLESDDRLSPTTTLRSSARDSNSVPAEKMIEPAFIECAGIKISTRAIDILAGLAGIEKSRARLHAEATLIDWVARKDVPKYPMTVMKIILNKMANNERGSRDRALATGMGRG